MLYRPNGDGPLIIVGSGNNLTPSDFLKGAKMDRIAQLILDDLVKAGISVHHSDDEMEWLTLNRLRKIVIVRLEKELKNLTPSD